MPTTPTLWSDQDGVIAVYELHAYRPSPTNPNPVFFQPNAHYYQNVKPDKKIIEAYRICNSLVPLYVLTNITHDTLLQEEHKTDKIKWTKQHMNFLDLEEQYYPIQIPKHEFAMQKLHRPLQKTDVLISDYNKDLIPWVNAGGTAVKYLNGINSKESYNGPHIPQEWSTDNIVDYIQTLLQKGDVQNFR